MEKVARGARSQSMDSNELNVEYGYAWLTRQRWLSGPSAGTESR